MDDDDVITLKIRDQSGEILMFKVKKSTQFSKIFMAYGKRVGLSISKLKFTLDGDRITETETPEDYDLEDQDQIDVFLEQIGGGSLSQSESEQNIEQDSEQNLNQGSEQSKQNYSETETQSEGIKNETKPNISPIAKSFEKTTTSSSSDSDNQTLTVKVKGLNEEEVGFRVKNNTKLGKIFEVFASHFGLSIDSLRFVFDGQRLKAENTPKEIGILDGEVIEAVSEQLGGKI